MSDVDNGAAVAAAEPAAIAPPAQTASDPMTRITQTMGEAYDKINPPRENGRFAAKEKTPDAGENPAATSEAAVKENKDQNPIEAKVEPAQPAIDAPLSWSAEMKARWAEIPPDARPYIAQRETQMHQRISELGQQVKQTEPVRAVLEHYRDTFTRSGLDPADGIARLLNVEAALSSDPASAIQEIAKAYGVDHLLGGQTQTQGEDNGEVRSLKAELAQLKRFVSETANKMTARERLEYEQSQAALMSKVQQFASQKADFAELENDLIPFVAAIKSKEPQLSPDEVLEKAYEAAKWANPTMRQKLLSEQEKAREEKAAEEAKKKAAEAKKAASINVKSAGASPARKGSWEETLRSVGEKIAS